MLQIRIFPALSAKSDSRSSRAGKRDIAALNFVPKRTERSETRHVMSTCPLAGTTSRPDGIAGNDLAHRGATRLSAPCGHWDCLEHFGRRSGSSSYCRFARQHRSTSIPRHSRSDRKAREHSPHNGQPEWYKAARPDPDAGAETLHAKSSPAPSHRAGAYRPRHSQPPQARRATQTPPQSVRAAACPPIAHKRSRPHMRCARRDDLRVRSTQGPGTRDDAN